MSMKRSVAAVSVASVLALGSGKAGAFQGDGVSAGTYDFYNLWTPSNDYVNAVFAASGFNLYSYPSINETQLGSGASDHRTSAFNGVDINILGSVHTPFQINASADLLRKFDTSTGALVPSVTRTRKFRVEFMNNLIMSKALNGGDGAEVSFTHTTPTVTLAAGSMIIAGITFTGKLRANGSFTASSRATGQHPVISFPATDTVRSRGGPSVRLEAFGSVTVAGFGPYGILELVTGSFAYESSQTRTFNHIGFGVAQSNLHLQVSSPASLNLFGGELGFTTPFDDIRLVTWGSPLTISGRLNPTWSFTRNGFFGFI
jgi:hypothetical protein